MLLKGAVKTKNTEQSRTASINCSMRIMLTTQPLRGPEKQAKTVYSNSTPENARTLTLHVGNNY